MRQTLKTLLKKPSLDLELTLKSNKHVTKRYVCCEVTIRILTTRNIINAIAELSVRLSPQNYYPPTTKPRYTETRVELEPEKGHTGT